MTFEIRKDRKPQGRRILVPEREEYFRLMDLVLRGAHNGSIRAHCASANGTPGPTTD
ncbi:hypothetical protein [Streptomyces sp. NPDC017964]|uniref:hypothetical protein n=1 Tax=Streptomyces sp. NPDC017964 TaxID=3365022 RepID=UPI0037937BC7